MFYLCFHYFTFVFTRAEARDLRRLCWSKAKEGAGETYFLLHGDVPSRGRIPWHNPRRDPAVDSLLAFAVSGRLGWVTQAQFAEFERAVTRASLGHCVRFRIGPSCTKEELALRGLPTLRPLALTKKDMDSHLRFGWKAFRLQETADDSPVGAA
jgi:hypothetical protein